MVAEVAQAAVALGGSVELCDLRDPEAVHELLPDGLTQTVAQSHAHPVLSLRVANRLVQQVSADLANVLHDLEENSETGRMDLQHGELLCRLTGQSDARHAYGAVVFDAVVPETRGGELLSDDDSHAVDYTLAHSHNVPCRQRHGSVGAEEQNAETYGEPRASAERVSPAEW